MAHCKGEAANPNTPEEPSENYGNLPPLQKKSRPPRGCYSTRPRYPGFYLEAAEWARHQYDLVHLWHVDRLQRLQSAIEAQPTEHISRTLRAFAWPQEQLIQWLHDPALPHKTRAQIGDILAALGDPRPGVGVDEAGTPVLDWVAIPGSTVTLEGGARAQVAPFHLARYPVTNAQFQAFVDAPDGYRERGW